MYSPNYQTNHCVEHQSFYSTVAMEVLEIPPYLWCDGLNTVLSVPVPMDIDPLPIIYYEPERKY